ncbi:MAG: cyanophycin synthetase [Leptolyngbyaceae cyanobacterium SL_7_1]|nr:cyanophycin synthetase [Leptolyngbyaceae cyanobacterium SL_7_1]
MVLEHPANMNPVNARANDVFDVFNFKHYIGPNPYLERGALVFEFSLSGNREPLSIKEYGEAIASRYPQLGDRDYDSYGELFAHTVAEVSRLDMDLYCDRWSLTTTETGVRIAVESIHESTSHGVVYAVWDWFETITQDQRFYIQDQIELLQKRFRRSVYGGPTVYALLRTAHYTGIPAFYLPDEGLMQYGYGKNLVRGVATTFDCDSHLDSDFTTRKDDCKAFLDTLGFPVPKGEIVITLDQALKAADAIGYPVAVKPVVGHKGIGVTAEVRDDDELEFAFDRAVEAHPEDHPINVIVERSIPGADYRLLCVDGKFVAAMERRPATVIGDGYSTIADLIDRENLKPERLDTPTSAMGKIVTDDSMKRYLAEQGISLDTVVEADRAVSLRKVANLSAGGVSIDATNRVHPDTIILAQDIAQHFRLVCLGIDILTPDIGRSWKEGKFGIVEINSAPGIYMHLRPAVGDPVDVTSHILGTFFESGESSRIPIFTFNYLPLRQLRELIDHILLSHPHWTIGAVCRETALVNRAEKRLSGDHNTKVQSLLRNPKLDLLIAEYRETELVQEGLFYDASHVVILDDPSEVELSLTRDVLEGATLVIKQGATVSIRKHGLVEQFELAPEESFSPIYLKEISAVLHNASEHGQGW